MPQGRELVLKARTLSGAEITLRGEKGDCSRFSIGGDREVIKGEPQSLKQGVKKETTLVTHLPKRIGFLTPTRGTL